MSDVHVSLPRTDHETPSGGRTGLRYEQPARPTCSELSPPERLVLWTIRALAESQNNWPDVQREFWLRCGPVTIESVLQGLTGMLTTLALHRRRILCVRHVTSLRVSADEVALLTLVAAAQLDQSFKLAALVRWLVGSNGQDAMTTHTLNFAGGLMRSRVCLAHTESKRA